MKQKNSQKVLPSGLLVPSGEKEYLYHPRNKFPFLTLSEGAKKVGVSTVRLSRILRVLSVPVYRRGHVVFLDPPAVERVKTAIKRKEIQPGRKRKIA